MENVKLRLKRSHNLDSAVISCHCEDIDGDGEKEVIVGTYNNFLKIFKIEDNTFIEIAALRNPSPITSIGCGDLDQNGEVEIFVAGRDKYLRVYNVNQGMIIEKGKHKFFDMIHDITVGDVFSNDVSELVVSAGKVISILSYYMNDLKEEGILRQIHEVLQTKIMDIDDDGKNDDCNDH